MLNLKQQNINIEILQKYSSMFAHSKALSRLTTIKMHTIMMITYGAAVESFLRSARGILVHMLLKKLEKQ